MSSFPLSSPDSKAAKLRRDADQSRINAAKYVKAENYGKAAEQNAAAADASLSALQMEQQAANARSK